MNQFIKLFPNPSLVYVLSAFLAHPDEELYQSSKEFHQNLIS